jgi:hypothetical protein
MKVLPGIDLQDVVHFHEKWMLLLAVIGLVVILLCAFARHSTWIYPVWLLSVFLTGLHTAWLVWLALAGLQDFAALGVMFLAMFSWPVSATFVLLLFVRPRPKGQPNLELGASPNGGPGPPLGTGVGGGPPSVG